VTDREAKIADLLGRGYSVKGIAKALGVTDRQVYRLINANPAIRAQAAKLMEERDPDAVSVLRALLHDPDPKIRLQAATALLRTRSCATRRPSRTPPVEGLATAVPATSAVRLIAAKACCVCEPNFVVWPAALASARW
jgi:HEAT repeat protein